MSSKPYISRNPTVRLDDLDLREVNEFDLKMVERGHSSGALRIWGGQVIDLKAATRKHRALRGAADSYESFETAAFPAMEIEVDMDDLGHHVMNDVSEGEAAASAQEHKWVWLSLGAAALLLGGLALAASLLAT